MAEKSKFQVPEEVQLYFKVSMLKTKCKSQEYNLSLPVCSPAVCPFLGLSDYLSFCLPVCLFGCLGLSISQSVRQSVSQSVCLFVCLSHPFPACLSVDLSVSISCPRLLVCLSVCLSVHLSFCWSIRLFVRSLSSSVFPFTHLPVWLSFCPSLHRI